MSRAGEKSLFISGTDMYMHGPDKSSPLPPAVAAVLEEHGAFDDHTHGQLCMIPVPRAFTFMRNRVKET